MSALDDSSRLDVSDEHRSTVGTRKLDLQPDKMRPDIFDPVVWGDYSMGDPAEMAT